MLVDLANLHRRRKINIGDLIDDNEDEDNYNIDEDDQRLTFNFIFPT